VTLRPRPGNDEGISLVELLVATVITTMLLSLVAAMFIQITKVTGDGRSTQKATGIASTVMTEVAGVVRQATQVATSSSATEGAVVGGVDSVCAGASGSTPSCLIVDTYSNVTVAPGQSDVAPVRVVFSVDAAGNLLEKRYAGVLASGYYGFSTSPVASSRTVGGPVDVTAGGTDALFVYWDTAGNQVVPGAAGLTAAQAATVTDVTVNVSVGNPLSRGADPVLLSNRIAMPNVAIVNGGS
jgi:Tfp pilus assembly protein PilW